LRGDAGGAGNAGFGQNPGAPTMPAAGPMGGMTPGAGMGGGLAGSLGGKFGVGADPAGGEKGANRDSWKPLGEIAGAALVEGSGGAGGFAVTSVAAVAGNQPASNDQPMGPRGGSAM